jgi:hypothetical protein
MSSKHSHPDFKEGNDRYVGANKSSQAHLSLSVAWQSTDTAKVRAYVCKQVVAAKWQDSRK